MNIFYTKLFFLIFMVMATNFSAAQQKTVFCFGNSLTAGYGLPKEKSWPMLIQDKLKNSGYDYKVIQSGLSGETSAGGLSRIKWVLREPADIFILELGPNDGLRGLPTEQTVMNLQKIIDYVIAKNKNTKILIAGMKVPPNMGPEYSEKFESIYSKLAEINKATLIPFFLEGVAGQKALNLNDGIHPNEEGQKIVAETVWKYLKPVL